jgi:hypothetical protein
MKHCENCKCDEAAALAEYVEKSAVITKRLEDGDVFTDAELKYAAYARCPCGAGMAYPRNTSTFGYWDCSAILKGTADKNVQHTAQKPFTFWEIKGEGQPSVNGATTRPVTEGVSQ